MKNVFSKESLGFFVRKEIPKCRKWVNLPRNPSRYLFLRYCLFSELLQGLNDWHLHWLYISCCCYILTENSGKAEIAELDDSIFGKQNVFWLHITMNTIVQVTVIDCLEGLPDDTHCCRHRYSNKKKRKCLKSDISAAFFRESILPFGMLFQFIENRSFTVFKDQMQFPFPSEDFNQIDQVGMLQIFQHPYLT